MLSHLLRTTLRALLRQRRQLLLTTASLALAMTGFVMIARYLQVDLTWDGFHAPDGDLYRVVERADLGSGNQTHISATMPALGPALQRELPEAQNVVRLHKTRSKLLVSRGESRFYQKEVNYVDPAFVDIFKVRFLQGNPATALADPSSAVLSSELAQLYFGEQDPLGQVLLVQGTEHIVRGVIEPMPDNSILTCELLLPFNALPQSFTENWRSDILTTFVLLAPGTDPTPIGEKIEAIYQAVGAEKVIEFELQPFDEIHLGSSHIAIDLNPGKGSWTTVIILATIALLILALGIFNFVNLTTAQASRRAGEVGLRKVVGATRERLIGQFLLEALLTATIALLMAGLLLRLLEPQSLQLTGRELALDPFADGRLALLLVALAALVGLAAGAGPAALMASFRPTTMLMGRSAKQGGRLLRGSLVVAQFSVTIALLIVTGTILLQLHYVHSRPLGFQREQVLSIELADPGAMMAKWPELRDELRNLPGTLAASAMRGEPGRITGQTYLKPEGSEEVFFAPYLEADGSTDDLLELTLLEGEFFDERKLNSAPEDYFPLVVNKSMVERLGWSDPVGKRVTIWGSPGEIIGVLADFHAQGLRHEIEPLFLFHYPAYADRWLVRGAAEDVGRWRDQVQTVFERFFPDQPFEARWLDQNLQQLYSDVQREAAMLRGFSLLAALIATLGLVGLASHAAARRRHELGVRKVLGARRRQLAGLISGEFALLVLIANAVAWPFAFWFSLRWLEQFAYHAPVAWWLAPLAGLAVLVLALATVLAQTWRSLLINPVEVLRSE